MYKGMIETQITKFLNVPKLRTFNSVVDATIQTDVGNFVLVKNLTGLLISMTQKYTFMMICF